MANGICFKHDISPEALELAAGYPLAALAGDTIDAARAEFFGAAPHVSVIGCGKIARDVLRVLMADSVLPARGGGLVAVRYTVCDGDEERKSYERGAGVYDAFVASEGLRREDYLPLPPVPWKIEFASAKEAEDAAERAAREGAVSVAVYADEDRAQNAAAAGELQARTVGSVKVFALAEKAAPGVVCFGSDGGRAEGYLCRLAYDRHKTYAAEWMPGCTDEELTASAEKEIAAMSPVIAGSNVMAALGLRTKLLLAGFDLAPAGGAGDASREWEEAYFAGDPPRYGEGTLNGKRKLVYRNVDLGRDGLRGRLARQEHDRWNAYMFTCGFLPSTRPAIASETKGKDMAGGRHGNLTTFEGLVEFRRIVAAAFSKSEEAMDVIRYDYQLADDAAWFAARAGFGIVRAGR